MRNIDIYSFILIEPFSHSVIVTYLFCGLRKARLNPALNQFGVNAIKKIHFHRNFQLCNNYGFRTRGNY